MAKTKKKFNALNYFKKHLKEDSDFENENSSSERLFQEDRDRVNKEKMRLVRNCKSKNKVSNRIKPQ